MSLWCMWSEITRILNNSSKYNSILDLYTYIHFPEEYRLFKVSIYICTLCIFLLWDSVRGSLRLVTPEPVGQGHYQLQTSNDRGRGLYTSTIDRKTMVHNNIYTILVVYVSCTPKYLSVSL